MTKSSWPPKTRRVSRRPRLQYEIVIGPPPDFKPTAADWERMELAYGPKLGGDDRENIVKLVTYYFHLGQVGRNAPFVDDAKQWLAKVQKAAESARKNMEVISKELLSDEQTENVAEFHARYRIEKHLKKKRHCCALHPRDVGHSLLACLDG
jgi:hypothetical protein